ncbi:hypothetical protein CP556_20240 [Natrinema sp. CBA1119]|nr:hypothetical protein CP556_20240 [Natrinema sp. CBA1119]
MSIGYLSERISTKWVTIVAILFVSLIYAFYMRQTLAWILGLVELSVISAVIIFIYKLQNEID